MYRGNFFSRFSMVSLLSAGLLFGCGVAFAQTKPAAMPDAQIEANVLKALAGAPELADQSITSTTVYGVVTLNGTVRDEPLRDLAEHLVANTAGVQKVIDQLTIGTSAPAANDSQQDATNPNLQSDGTMAPPQGQNPQTQKNPNPSGAPQTGVPPQQGQYPPPDGSAPQRANTRRRRLDSIRRIRRPMIVRRIGSLTRPSILRIISNHSSLMLPRKVGMRLLSRRGRSCGFGSIKG